VWDGGVSQDRIEIDHAIEFATAANPVVNLLSTASRSGV